MTSMENNPGPDAKGQLLPAQHVPARMVTGARSIPAIVREPQPQAPENNISPALFLRVFQRWWMWVVPIGVVLAMIAAVVVLFMHVPLYEAVAVVKIESEAPFIAFEQGTVERASDVYVQTQIELMRGPTVLSRVLSRPEVAAVPELKRSPDPLKRLQEGLKISQVGKSELYRVTFTSPSAADAQNIANLVVAEYQLMQADEDEDRRKRVLEILDEENKIHSAQVDALRAQVVDLSKQVTGKDPFVQGTVADLNSMSTLAATFQTLTEVEVELEVAKAELQSMQNAPVRAADKMASSGVLDLEIANRPDVRKLEERIASIADAMATIQSKQRTRINDSWENDPEYVQLQQLTTTTRGELAALKARARKEMMDQRIEQQKSEHEQAVAGKEQEVAALTTKKDLLAKKVNDHKLELADGGTQSAILEFKKAELEREQRVFELIAERRLALQTEKRAPARVSKVYEAKVPAVAIEPIPFKLLGLACFASLLAPFGLAVGEELIARRVHSADDLSRESHLPTLGEIAQLPQRSASPIQTNLSHSTQRQLMVYAESIDSLRTNLLLTQEVGAPDSRKVVAICSAVSGEGKTSVSTSLALSIAQASKEPTLIVDADLRSPDIRSFFEVPEQPGVAEILTGAATVASAIHRVGNSQLYVMPAGRQRVNPHHVLHGARVDTLLQELREQFNTVIIDTPPILSASDSLVFAKAADMVVFCALSEFSRMSQVRSAVRRLEATKVHVAGTVLGGVAVQRYVYNYGLYGQRN